MHISCYIAGKAIYLPSYMALSYIAHILCYRAQPDSKANPKCQPNSEREKKNRSGQMALSRSEEL